MPPAPRLQVVNDSEIMNIIALIVGRRWLIHRAAIHEKKRTPRHCPGVAVAGFYFLSLNLMALGASMPTSPFRWVPVSA